MKWVVQLCLLVFLSACGGVEIFIPDGACFEGHSAVEFESSATVLLPEGQALQQQLSAGTCDQAGIRFDLAGADAALFALDVSTGWLNSIVELDFESPTDIGVNNIYNVVLTASTLDGRSAVQALSIQITDRPEFISQPVASIDATSHSVQLDWGFDNSSIAGLHIEQNLGGSAGFSAVDLDGDSAPDLFDASTGRTLIPHSIVEAQFQQNLYRLLAVDTNGDPVLQSDTANAVGLDASGLIQYIKASNTGGDDKFGRQMALSADSTTFIVSAYGEASDAIGVDAEQTDNSSSRAGAVYVLSRDGDSWVQQAYLKASNTESLDSFGDSLTISADGNTVAVAAAYEDGGASGVGGDQSDNSQTNSGAVYVYTRNAGVWSQQAYIKASNPLINDNFGVSTKLSADGDFLYVGSPKEDSGSVLDVGDTNNAGVVYIYSRSGEVWSQSGYIKPDSVQINMGFGFDLALSDDGTTLAVGGSTEKSAVPDDPTDQSLTLAGAVWVFTGSDNSWSQQAYLKSSHPDTGDRFGRAIDLSNDGDFLVVGSHRDDSGSAVDASDNSMSDSGAVFVFARNAGVWSQQAYIKPQAISAGSRFGFDVEFSSQGAWLAVGAHHENSSSSAYGGDPLDSAAVKSGAVYLFEKTDATWVQRNYLKASNTGAGDHFGVTVQWSDDARDLFVGSSLEGSAATGLDGDQTDNSASESGAVYLYSTR